ncbi:DUF368 domain-containing protein [Salipaludibacillus daqingensis]|uniref:DUF368 domain-containing protein n=1 Tax=Salipaludibacillus daqingensis TaxID=3041001 RepID=UPI002476FC32|nr:DUF368 domain-containing protein [Salipaludibacillus daqingensis]
MEWRNIYRGFLMGVSNIIPGVSAGTIALVLGIYDRLIESISDFFSSRWRQTLGFLVPLGIGVILPFILLSGVIKWLMENHHQPTQFFFLGLIIGVIPILLKESKLKEKFTFAHGGILILFAITLGYIGYVNPEPSNVLHELTFINGIWFFVAGAVASMSLLLPGMSGALVLILFGVYFTAMSALSLATLNVGVILVIGSGILFGFVISSKFIKYILTHFPSMTYAAIIGLLIGSTIVIYPGFTAGGSALFPSIITFIAGTLTAFLLGSKESN